MGYRRRHRRQLQRQRAALEAQAAGSVSASDVGGGDGESRDVCGPAPRPGWLARLSRLSATALGVALGAPLGGPLGVVIFGGLGAAIDWSRR